MGKPKAIVRMAELDKLDALKAQREIIIGEESSDQDFNPFNVDAAEMIRDAITENWFEARAEMGIDTKAEYNNWRERWAQRRTLSEHAIQIAILEMTPRARKAASKTWLSSGIVYTFEDVLLRKEPDGIGRRSREHRFNCIFCGVDLATLGNGAVTEHLMTKMRTHVDVCAMELLIELHLGGLKPRTD